MPTMEMVRSQFHLPTSAAAAAPSIQLQHQNTAGDIRVQHIQDSDDSAQAKSSHTATAYDSMELGPNLKRLAEESLEEERCGQLNQLGSRVQERWNTYRELLGSQGRIGLGTEECDHQ